MPTAALTLDSPSLAVPTLRESSARVRCEDPLLPVLPALAPLFPSGALRRGTTVQVTGSLALVSALLAAPSATGSWCAVVDIPEFGAAAAAEIGVDLERLALVPAPGGQWSAVVAALIDGVDVIAVRPPSRVRSGETRRLAARIRERGAVLLPVGPWEGVDVRLSAAASRWVGLADSTAGGGAFRARRLRVQAEGRGAAARARQAELWLPARGGGVEPAEGEPQVTSAIEAPPDPPVWSEAG